MLCTGGRKAGTRTGGYSGDVDALCLPAECVDRAVLATEEIERVYGTPEVPLAAYLQIGLANNGQVNGGCIFTPPFSVDGSSRPTTCLRATADLIYSAKRDE